MPTATLLVLTNPDHRSAVLEFFNQKRTSQQLPPLQENDPTIQWRNTSGESIGIDEIRELTTTLSYAHAKEQYYCILHADLLTIPAQHAFLKSLEEPPAKVHLCLTCASPDLLLPTITSRCHTITQYEVSPLDTATKGAAQEFWKQLKTASYADLITQAENYKDRDAATTWCDTLLRFFYEAYTDSPSGAAAPTLVAAQQVVLEHLTHLRAHGNTRLCVESCFFKLKQIHTASSIQ